jgi:benzoyl-CoA reductase subunit BamC
VITDRLNNKWLPVFAGEYTAAECMGRDVYIIDGKEYLECDFCRAACPSRDLFKEPDSKLPLKCDMCESDPDLKEPMCVQVCLNDVLVYEEREEEVEEQTDMELVQVGLQSMVDKYGLENVLDTINRMTQKEQ